MNPRIWILAAALSLLSALSFSSFARTVTVMPGVANQTTATATFFPNDMAVKVTDDSGNPLRGVQVNFSDDDGVVFFTGVGFTFSGDAAAITGADGIAVAPPLMGFEAGTTTMDVTTVGIPVISATIPLRVLPGGPAQFKVISGSHQVSPVGYTYPDPWVAQALDATGSPVPFAAVRFYAPTATGVPSGTFNGINSLWVEADGNGIAVSPYFTANDVKGHAEGLAMTLNTSVPARSAFFAYTNLPAPAATRCEKDKGPACGP